MVTVCGSIGLVTFLLISVSFSIQLIEVSSFPKPAAAVEAPHKQISKLANSTPIVLWHGFNNSAEGIQPLVTFLKKQVPGVYVLSLMIGNNSEEDILNTFQMDSNEQVKLACKIIAKDKRLQKGYNAFGLSQGGLFFRAVAQRCPEPPIKNLITLGTPHQGIYGIPLCSDESASLMCDVFKHVMKSSAYEKFLQHFLTQAQYWHDPFKTDERYRKKSVFLADINNERRIKNKFYKENMLKLKNFVMVKFSSDSVVKPVISEWFGFFDEDNDHKIVELKDLPLYKEDWLGLRKLNDSGRLHFLETQGEHMTYDWEWIDKNIVQNFLT